MSTGAVVILLVIWNFVGLFILGMSSRIGYMLEVDRLNPIYIYEDHRVNWFGAFVVALIMNAICPVVSVVYWFSKLCTVGRKY